MSYRWYVSGRTPVAGGSSDGYDILTEKNGEPVRGLITSPVYYNGILYGTENNPIYRVSLSDGLLFSYRYYYIDADIRLAAGYDATGTFAVNGSYTNVVGVNDDDIDVVIGANTSFGMGSRTEDTIISGKWRAKQNWDALGVNDMPNYLIPLVATITLTNGNIYTCYSIGNTTNDNYAKFSIVQNENIISFGSNSSTYNTQGTIEEDMVIDFGTIGQHVPKFFYNKIYKFFDKIYNNTYTIKTNNGELITQITEQPPIIRTDLISAGNAYQLAFTGENGIVQTLNWEMETPENKRFVGLSNTPKGEVLIPLGEHEITIEYSTSFYPVFVPYRPFTTPFQIELYKNTAEANRVDKTDYLTYVRAVGGVMRESSSVTDLTITLQLSEYPDFNYVKIPILKRYYFVNDITLINANLYELDLSVDPLMSYKNAILGLTAFVDRAENARNPYIIDKKMVVEQGVDITSANVANQVFDEVFDPETSVRFVMNGYKISVRANIL